jgi:hypothetical protein
MTIVVIICFTALLAPAQIVLKGFVPHDINEAVILYEYKKICKILAPYERVDLSPITVSFYSKKMAEKKSFSLPEWGGGGAIGKHSIIVHIDKKPFLNHSLYQTAVHELVHIAINRICDNFTVPRWFHEGLAMFLSGEVSERENIVVSKALFIGGLMSLSSIDSVNSFGKFRAELAYCQSRQVVRYLVETYGMDVIPELIQASKETGSFWNGYHEVLRISETELESYYRKFIMEHHGRFFWLVDTYLVWGVIVLLFLTAYILTLIRIRRKKRLMEAVENTEAEVEGGDLI